MDRVNFHLLTAVAVNLYTYTSVATDDKLSVIKMLKRATTWS